VSIPLQSDGSTEVFERKKTRLIYVRSADADKSVHDDFSSRLSNCPRMR
jgi:hypothetical protein